MAETESGRDWMMKALHPSDTVAECRGVPDESSFPTVSLNYQTIHRLVPPPTLQAGKTWDFDMNVIPDLIHHAGGVSYQSDNASQFFASFGVMNSSIQGGSYSDKFTSFLGQYPVRFRISSYGLSMYMDGPTLANQGTLAVMQMPVSPIELSTSQTRLSATPTGKVQGTSVTALASAPTLYFPSASHGSYEATQTVPTAYLGPAKDGCYMPLRLTETAQDWVTVHDASYYGGTLTASGQYFGPPEYRLSGRYDYAATSAVGVQPYTQVHTASESGADPRGGEINGDLIFPPQNGMWGFVAGRGLSETTTMNMFFRVGVEMQVLPGSQLSPYNRVSPPYDPVAIANYFEISRHLKDAYPVEYNDLGKLWDVIKKVASTLSPALNLIPGVGPVLAAGAPHLISGLDSIIRPKKHDAGNSAAAATPHSQEIVDDGQSRAQRLAQSVADARRQIGKTDKARRKVAGLRH